MESVTNDKIIKHGVLTLACQDSEWRITECETDAVEVLIPAEVDGMPVTAIGECAFADCKRLAKVEFSDIIDYIDAGVILFEIGDYAFKNCISITEIELPEIVGFIGRGAFYECTSLRVADIPDCYVGPYAFYGCEALESVTPIRCISEGVFSHCKSLSVFPVAEGAKEIGEDAFYHCYCLVDITIPASVDVIEPLAFRSCKNLARVSFAAPEGWYCRSRYKRGEFPIDQSNPEKNAKKLSGMDFDDGVSGWYRKA